MDADDVVVVTAERIMRERVVAAGGSSVGPSWLLRSTSSVVVRPQAHLECAPSEGGSRRRPIRARGVPSLGGGANPRQGRVEQLDAPGAVEPRGTPAVSGGLVSRTVSRSALARRPLRCPL